MSSPGEFGNQRSFVRKETRVVERSENPTSMRVEAASVGFRNRKITVRKRPRALAVRDGVLAKTIIEPEITVATTVSRSSDLNMLLVATTARHLEAKIMADDKKSSREGKSIRAGRSSVSGRSMGGFRVVEGLNVRRSSSGRIMAEVLVVEGFDVRRSPNRQKRSKRRGAMTKEIAGTVRSKTSTKSVVNTAMRTVMIAIRMRTPPSTANSCLMHLLRTVQQIAITIRSIRAACLGQDIHLS